MEHLERAPGPIAERPSGVSTDVLRESGAASGPFGDTFRCLLEGAVGYRRAHLLQHAAGDGPRAADRHAAACTDLLPLRLAAMVYVEFFRGIPVLLLLYFLYYGLPVDRRNLPPAGLR